MAEKPKALKIAWLGFLILWVVLCFIGPWLPIESSIHSFFGFCPPNVLIVPMILGVLGCLYRVVRKKAKGLDIAVFVVLGLSMLMVLGYELPATKHGDGTPIRVMTFNVELNSREVPALRDEIIQRKVDLVMLQEVKGGKGSPAEYLRKELKGWSMVAAGEVAILSRWSLAETKAFPLTSTPGRYGLIASVGGPRPFRAMTVHWTVPQITKGLSVFQSSLAAQILNYDDTVKALDDERMPLVFGGDFNNPPRHGLSRRLSSKFMDAFSEAGSGLGYTYPSRLPISRIDHLYSTPALKPVHAEVGPSLFSDHRSLIADYVFQ